MFKYTLLALAAVSTTELHANTRMQAKANTDKMNWGAMQNKAKGAADASMMAQTNADKIDWDALLKKAKGAIKGWGAAQTSDELA